MGDTQTCSWLTSFRGESRPAATGCAAARSDDAATSSTWRQS
jgi:hypothetical protein